MTDVTLKIILGSLLLLAGATAFLTMMTLLGRTGKSVDPVKLRRAHRTAGFAFLALLAPLLYIGAGFVRAMGDSMPTRAVFHIALASTLICVLLLKVLVVRYFKPFAKFAPALGMTLFVLTLVVYIITAGFVFLRGAGG